MEDPILTEAERMRQHELAVAKLANKRLMIEAEEKAGRTHFRRCLLSWVLGVLAVFLLAGGITVTALHNVDQNRKKEIQRTKMEQQTAQECIRQGNIWMDGDCVLSRKEK